MKNDSGTLESAEMLSEKIRSIVSSIKTDSDTNPVELEEIKKLIRKNVPFTMRGAFSAYILRALIAQPAPSKKNDRRRDREDRRKKETAAPVERKKESFPKQEEKKAPAPKAPKAEPAPVKEKAPRAKEEEFEQREIPENARTLYVSVGRMKHLYPKQLSEIFQEALGITREDIYSIRIHDKYSFVTLSAENCEKAIEKITGMNINGRTANVTYSRLENKGDKAAPETEKAPEPAPAPEPVVEEAPAAETPAEN